MIGLSKGRYKRQVLLLASSTSDLPLEKSPALSVKIKLNGSLGSVGL